MPRMIERSTKCRIRYVEVASRGGSPIRFPFLRILVYKLSQVSTPKRFGPISRRSRSASRSCRRAAFDGFATRWRICSNLRNYALNRYSLNFGPTVVPQNSFRLFHIEQLHFVRVPATSGILSSKVLFKFGSMDVVEQARRFV